MPLIVAHRGASHDAPENTLASARLGWAQAADAVEVDVHLTRDGAVVVIHDDTLLRTTGRDARVVASTLEEIRRLDAGSWKGARWRGERVPTLAEVLATIPEGRRLFVELKASGAGEASTLLAPAVARALAGSPVPAERVTLISFERELLREAGRLLPACGTLLLADTDEGAPEKLPGLVAICGEDGFDGLGVSADWPIDARLVERLREKNIRLNVWTVNDAARARELAAAGVASITTNRPGWLRERLGEGTDFGC